MFASQTFVGLCQQSAHGGAVSPDSTRSGDDQISGADGLAQYNTALKLHPDDAEIVLRLGRLKAKHGDFEGAVQDFQRALQMNPAWAEAHYNLGLALIAKSASSPDWSHAILEFSAALRFRPDYPEAANMLAIGYIETQRPADAVPVLESALRAHPDEAELLFNYGRALEEVGQTTAARDKYAAAVEARRYYPDAQARFGNLLLSQGDLSSAVIHLQLALASNPDLRTAHYGLAKAWKALGQVAKAEMEFEQTNALIQRESDVVRSSHLSNDGLDLARKGDFAGAIHSLRDALALNPDNAIAHYNLGLLLADAGDLHGGILELRKAISLMPTRVSAYINMCRMQVKNHDQAGALLSLKTAALLDPPNQQVQDQRTALAAAASLEAGSERSMGKVASFFVFGAPEDTVAGHMAFAAELSKEGDDLGAIGELRHALSLHPDEEQTRHNLALVHLRSGDLKNARLELYKLLYASPDSVEVHLALGSLLIQQKSNTEAATELRRVLALQPDHAEAKHLLAQALAASTPP